MYAGQNVLLYAFRYQFPFKTTLVSNMTQGRKEIHKYTKMF